MGRMTARRLERLRKPGKYSDGGTLYVFVTEHTTKTGERRIRKQFVQRVNVHGKRVEIGLGGYPFVSLTDARDQAIENRRIARKGGDPRALASADVPTFGQAAHATLDAFRSRWADGTARQFLPLLESSCEAIWDAPIDRVERAQVLGILEAAQGSNRKKLTIRIGQVFDWATVYGHCTGDAMPRNGQLRAVMDTRKRSGKHHESMPWADVPAFFAALPESASGRCLAFLLLAGALRSNEARNLRWSNIDMDACLITLPAERMKSRREFVQPLTTAARAILDAMPRKGDLVFPSERTGRALSDMALQGLTKNVTGTVHGFRASFSTWAAENGQDETAVEHALHHLTGSDVSRCYNRSDYRERRRTVLDAWNAHVLGGK